MNDILIIDDDTGLCGLVTELLAREGYHTRSVHNGESGVQQALQGEYSLIVLDVMLPGIGGFEVLRRLRAHSQVPVLMLTARGDDVDRIVGLEIGADDYLPKPFNPRELVARIGAILRRTQNHQNHAVKAPVALASPTAGVQMNVGDVELDPAARSVLCKGKDIELTAVEFDLLEALLRAAGQVVSREAIGKAALGREPMPYDRSLDTHMSNLRRKLGPAGDGGERIKTLRSLGYLYVVPKPCVDNPPASGRKAK